MRHDVVVFVNGRRHRVAPAMAFGPLAYFLREECGLVGTKVGCGEGDCGACTVLVGRPLSGAIRYRAATSCLLTPCLVDGAHVVTIEGLGGDGLLTPVQRAMIDHHGSQCGYCTPGIVMALSGLFESDAATRRRRACRDADRQPLPLHGLPADPRSRPRRRA